MTLLDEDFAVCGLPSGWTNTSNPTGCGFAFSPNPPSPPIGTPTPTPAPCVAYTDASACAPNDSTNDRLTTTPIDAAGFESLTLTVRYFLPASVNHNLSFDVSSTIGGTDSYDLPELNNWQTQDLDISGHAGADDLTIAFVSDDLGSGDYGTAIHSVQVVGHGATGNIIITSPDDLDPFSTYPVRMEVVHSANALERLGSRVELFGSQLGMLTPISSTQAELQINNGLVQGNNTVRVCLTDANFDVACDDVTFVWTPHTGDLNGDEAVTILDVVGTVSLVLTEGFNAIVDMNDDGEINVLDVIIMIRLIVSCHPPAINVALGGQGSYDNVCLAGSENFPVDGSLGAPYGQTCNTPSPNHWWEVDLGRRFQIEQINLWNRVEPCCEDRMDKLVIEIYDGNTLMRTHPSSGWLTYSAGEAQLPVTISATTGDRVRIVKVGEAPSGFTEMYLGEVQVLGRPVDNECKLVPQYVWALLFEEAGATASTTAGDMIDSGSALLHATAESGLAYVDGDTQRGGTTRALRFPGSSNAQTVAILNATRGEYLDFGTDESFSAETLFTTTTSGTMTLLSNDDGAGAGWWLRLVDGYVEFTIIDASGGQATVTSLNTVNQGNWVHVVAVRDTGTGELRVYIDNTLNKTALDTTSDSLANNRAVRVGRANDTGTPYRFTGDMDFARISNFVIDPADIPISLPYFEPFDSEPNGFMSFDLSVPPEASDWLVATLGASGTNSLMSEDSANSGTIAWFGDSGWTNYEAGVWVSPPANNEVGVLARVSDQNNFYRFKVDGATGEVEISARVNGVENVLSSRTLSCTGDGDCPASLHCASNTCGLINVGEWMHLSLSVEGVVLTGAINGEDVITGRDARLASGEIGLYTSDMAAAGPGYGQLMAFDGLSVVPVDGFGIPYTDSLEKERNGVVMEDFATAGEPSEWTFYSGALVQLSEIGGSHVSAGSYGSVYGTGNPRWDNYSFSAEVSVGSGGGAGADAVGLVARMTGPGDFYLFSGSDHNSHFAHLSVYVDGVRSLLATSTYVLDPTVTYTMSIEVDGTTIRGELDDPDVPGIELQLSAVDTSHSHGSVGFQSWENSNATFDNISIGATNCGTGQCEPGIGETRETCAADCSSCGDTFCDSPYENVTNCQIDCHFCGDAVCDGDEDNSNCPDDCCEVDSDCSDGNDCTADVCNVDTCENTYESPGTSCEDYNDCTFDDECNGAGVCGGDPITCNDVGTTCGARRSCNGTSTCTETFPGTELACPGQDSNACTYDDRCNGAGACEGTLLLEADLNGDDIPCDDGPGICGANRSCNGGSSCTVDYPDNLVVCDDLTYCTATDRCDGDGSCVGSGSPCLGTICNDVCNEAGNNCFTTEVCDSDAACKDDLDGTYSDRSDSVCAFGSCDPPAYNACGAAYACNGALNPADGDACATACSSNDDDYCATGYTCEGTACTAQLPDLKSCDEASDCDSGFCRLDFDGTGSFCAPSATTCVFDSDGSGDAEFSFATATPRCTASDHTRTCNNGVWSPQADCGSGWFCNAGNSLCEDLPACAQRDGATGYNEQSAGVDLWDDCDNLACNTGFCDGSFGCTVASPPAAPTAANVNSCGPGSVSLVASGSSGHYRWWDAAAAGNFLAFGATYNTPVLNADTNYWVESFEPVPFTTTYAGGQQRNGSMFDVENTSGVPVTIHSFDVNIGTGSYTMRVYYRTDSYVGHESSSAGWTQLGEQTVSGAGFGNPTEVVVTSLEIPNGATYGLYVTTTGGTSYQAYTIGSNSYSDSAITVTTGAGIVYPFGSPLSGRSWNGSVNYSTTVTTCTGPRTGVTAVIDPQTGRVCDNVLACTSDAADLACCDNPTTDCVSGGGCYDTATHDYDVDANGDDEYCASGTWYDCFNAGDCDPTGEYASGETTHPCLGSSDCAEACTSNDCIYQRNDGWGDCDVAAGCVSGRCVQDTNYLATFVGSGACDANVGAICTNSAANGFDTCVEAGSGLCLIDHDRDDAMNDCTGANCLRSHTETFDLDGDGDLDYCNNGTWQDCNLNAHCDGSAGYRCQASDCINTCVQNGDCPSGFFCGQAGSCTPRLAQNAACTAAVTRTDNSNESNGACLSGFCRDDYDGSSNADGNCDAGDECWCVTSPTGCSHNVAAYGNGASADCSVSGSSTEDASLWTCNSGDWNAALCGNGQYCGAGSCSDCTGSQCIAYLSCRDGVNGGCCDRDVECGAGQICVNETRVGATTTSCSSYTNTCRAAESLALGTPMTSLYSAGAWGSPFDQSECGDHAYTVPPNPDGNLCMRYAVYDDDNNQNTLIATYDHGDATTWTHPILTANAIWRYNYVIDVDDATGHFVQFEIREWDTGFGDLMWGYLQSETGAVDSGASTGCCDSATDCVDDSVQGSLLTTDYGCFDSGVCRDTGSTVSTNEFCDAGTWTDNDASQAACDACVTTSRWNIGGEADGSACCGDDSGEYREFEVNYSNGLAFVNGQDACCDVSSDCVAGSTCYQVRSAGTTAGGLNPGGNDNYAHCYNHGGSGKWLECDQSDWMDYWCGNICGPQRGVSSPRTGSPNPNWNAVYAGEGSVGEFPNMGTLGCCGDDANEFFRPSAGPTGDTTQACCNAATDCVMGQGCYSDTAVLGQSVCTVGTWVQPGLWTGAVSTEWSNAGNWDGGIIPTSSTHCQIPTGATRMPTISDTRVCGHLTVQVGATLNFADPAVAKLNIHGNITNNGTITSNSYRNGRYRLITTGNTTTRLIYSASTWHVDVQFGLTNAHTVRLMNPVNFEGRVHLSRATLDLDDKNLTVGEDLIITGTASMTAGSAASHDPFIDVSGDWSSAGGFTARNSTVRFVGGNQTLTGGDAFYRVQFNGTGTKTISSGTWSTAGGDYQTKIAAGATVRHTAGTFNVTTANDLEVFGTLTIAGGTFNTVSNNGSVFKAGSVLNVSAGTFFATGDTSFSNLTINLSGTGYIHVTDDITGTMQLNQSGGTIENGTGSTSSWLQIFGGNLTGGTMIAHQHATNDRGLYLRGNVTASSGHTTRILGTSDGTPRVGSGISAQLGNVVVEGNSDLKYDNGSSHLAIMGNFTINSGVDFDSEANPFSVAGNWDNVGTYTHGDNTVTLDGGNAWINMRGTGSGHTFFHLTITGGTKTLNANMRVDRNLTVTGTLTQGSGRIIYLYGNWMSASGTVNAHTASTTYFQGSENRTVNTGGGVHFGTLRVAKDTRTRLVTMVGNVGAHHVRLDTGSYVIGQYTHTSSGLFAVYGNGRLRMEHTSGNLYINGASTDYPAAFYFASGGDEVVTTGNIYIAGYGGGTDAINVASGGNFSPVGGTVHITGATDGVNIDGTGTLSFYDFRVSRTVASAKVNLQRSLDVNRDLLISVGNLNAAGQTTYVGRHWTNNSAFTHGNGNVRFDSSQASSILGTSGSAFWHVEVLKSSSTIAVTPGRILDIDGNVNINEGRLDLASAHDVDVAGVTYIRTGGELDVNHASSRWRTDGLQAGTSTSAANKDGFVDLRSGEVQVDNANTEVYGKILVTGGTFDSNYSMNNQNGGEVQVSGGTLSQHTHLAYNYSGAVFTVDGGTVTQTGAASFRNRGGILNISSGTFTTAVYIYNESWSGTSSDSNEINISGGTVNMNRFPNYRGQVNHTGGTINDYGYYRENYADISYYRASGNAVFNFYGTNDTYIYLKNTRGGTDATIFNHVNIQSGDYNIDTASTADWNIDGNFNINGGWLRLGNRDQRVAGHWQNNGGSFAHDGEYVYLDGSTQDTNLLGGSTTANPFYRLHINKSGARTVTMIGDLNVDDHIYIYDRLYTNGYDADIDGITRIYDYSSTELEIGGSAGGGTSWTTDGINVGTNSTSSGRLDMDAGTLTNDGVVFNISGMVDHDGGTIDNNFRMDVGVGGQYVMDGGALDSSEDVRVYDGAGTRVTLNGGTANLGSATDRRLVTVAYGGSTGDGQFTIAGATVTVKHINVLAGGLFTMTSGQFNINGLDNDWFSGSAYGGMDVRASAIANVSGGRVDVADGWENFGGTTNFSGAADVNVAAHCYNIGNYNSVWNIGGTVDLACGNIPNYSGTINQTGGTIHTNYYYEQRESYNTYPGKFVGTGGTIEFRGTNSFIDIDNDGTYFNNVIIAASGYSMGYGTDAYNEEFDVNGNFTINTGASIDFNGRAHFVRENVLIYGDYIADGNTLTMDPPGSNRGIRMPATSGTSYLNHFVVNLDDGSAGNHDKYVRVIGHLNIDGNVTLNDRLYVAADWQVEVDGSTTINSGGELEVNDPQSWYKTDGMTLNSNGWVDLNTGRIQNDVSNIEMYGRIDQTGGVFDNNKRLHNRWGGLVNLSGGNYWGYELIYNAGTLNISGSADVCVGCDGETDTTPDRHYLQTYSSNNAATPAVTNVTGGTLRTYHIYNDRYSTTNFSGGTVNGRWDIYNRRGTLNANGATINLGRDFINTHGVLNMSDGTFNIGEDLQNEVNHTLNDMNFTGGITNVRHWIRNYTGQIDMSAGTLNTGGYYEPYSNGYFYGTGGLVRFNQVGDYYIHNNAPGSYFWDVEIAETFYLNTGNQIWDVNGNFVINSGKTFTHGYNDLYVAGNYTNNGTYTHGSRTVRLDGNADTTFKPGTSTATNPYWDLTVAKTNGATVTLTGHLNIDQYYRGYSRLLVNGGWDADINVTSNLYSPGAIAGATGGELEIAHAGSVWRTRGFYTAGNTDIDLNAGTLWNSTRELNQYGRFDMVAGTTFDNDHYWQLHNGTVVNIRGGTHTQQHHIYNRTGGTFSVSGGTSIIRVGFDARYYGYGGTLNVSGGQFEAGEYLHLVDNYNTNLVNITGGLLSTSNMPIWGGGIVHTAGELRNHGYYDSRNSGSAYYRGSGTAVYTMAPIRTGSRGSHGLNFVHQSISATSTYFNDVNVTGAHTFHNSSDHNWDINGTFTIASGGSLNHAETANRMLLSGNWVNSSGTYTANAGIVEFDGGNATITTGGTAASKAFGIVVVSGATKTLSGNMQVNYDMNVTGTLAQGDNTIYVNRHWDSAPGNVTHGSGNVYFQGGTNANISTGGRDHFNYLHINKSNVGVGVTLNGNVRCQHLIMDEGFYDVNSLTHMSNGVIYAHAGSQLRESAGGNIYTGFVNARVALVSDAQGSCSWTVGNCHTWWRDALAARGITVVQVDVTGVDTLAEMQNYDAIIAPYGEYYPETSGTTVLDNIRRYVHSGGYWFESGGWNWYYAAGSGNLGSGGDDHVCVSIGGSSSGTRARQAGGTGVLGSGSSATIAGSARASFGMGTSYTECNDNPRYVPLYTSNGNQSGPAMHCYGSGCIVRTDNTDSTTADVYAQIMRSIGGRVGPTGSVGSSENGAFNFDSGVTENITGGNIHLNAVANGNDVIHIEAGGNFTPTGGTVHIGGQVNGADIAGAGTMSFHNLTINRDDTSDVISFDRNIDVNGDLTMHNGIVDANNRTIWVGDDWLGSWTRSGGDRFIRDTSNVVFDGSATQQIRGDTDFYSLTKNNGGGRTLEFDDGNLQSVYGTLTLRGSSASNRLNIRSSSGTAARLRRHGGQNIAFLDVQNNNASSGTAITCYEPGCYNRGGNTNWVWELPGDSCNTAQNLASLSNPYSGTTVSYVNHYSTCGMGSAPDRVFFYDVPNGQRFRIWQTTNNYDSRHSLRTDGSCVGTTELGCIGDPDLNTPLTYSNFTGSTKRVWYTQSGYSTGNGTFTIQWSLDTPPAGDACGNAQDLASLTSPYSGTTVGYGNDYSYCSMGSSADRVFYLDVPNSATIDIGQTTNGYDSRHTLRYGGSCPGSSQISCIDDPDTNRINWTNNTGSSQRVWYTQAGYSSSQGTFTLDWGLKFNYCGVSTNSTCCMGIQRVQVGSINHYTGTSSPVYTDYRDTQSTNMARNGSYPITLTGWTYPQYWRAWVDWNQDGDYNDSGEQYNIGSAGINASGTITVPAGATLGSTTMRVRGQYSPYGWPAACGHAYYSEVEEYTINVTAGPTPVTFSGSFTQGVTYPSCNLWNNFRGSLTESYSSITVSGSRDSTGRSCTGATANTICQALRNNQTGSWSCGGNTWRTGSCGGGLELAVGSGICQCSSTNYSVRPCINVNANWGGLPGTCSWPPTQTMQVTCQ